MSVVSQGLGTAGLVTQGYGPLTEVLEPCETTPGDMLYEGLSFLSSQLDTHATQCVTYVRGVNAVNVPATLGSKLLRLFDEFGQTRLEWTDMDFLISASKLKFNGSRVTPQRGDLIRIDTPDGRQTFEIVPLDDNEAPWRWSDPYHFKYRIHAKHIATEDAE